MSAPTEAPKKAYHFKEYYDAELKGKLDAFFGDFGNFRDVCVCVNSRRIIGDIQPYCFTLILARDEVTMTPKGRKKRKSYYAYLTVSQLGVSCEIGNHSLFPFDEMHKIVSKIEKGLEAYSFVPIAYELWSDYPDTPYYIGEWERSRCNTVVYIGEKKGGGEHG